MFKLYDFYDNPSGLFLGEFVEKNIVAYCICHYVRTLTRVGEKTDLVLTYTKDDTTSTVIAMNTEQAVDWARSILN